MSTTSAQMKRKAAAASIAASAFLAIAKLAAGLISGSLALISDAGHAGLDTSATILTYFAVRWGDMPADEDHHYGHAKVEGISALAETGVLMALAIGVAFVAVRRLLEGVGTSLHADWLAFAVLGVSIVVDLVRWRALRRVASQTASEALAADALHFGSDLLSSSLVLIGLAATRFGFAQGDAVAALAVAMFIAVAGVRLGHRTIDALLDAAPKGASQYIRSVIEAVPGVVAVEGLRLRRSGAQILGEVEIAVSRTLPIERAEELRNEVTQALALASPQANLTISAAPRALDSETVRDRVLLIAARRRLSVHHVTVQDLEGHKAVSLDVELDRRLTHGVAHEIASGLELAIRDELGQELEVETHIEPLDFEERVGADAAPEQAEAIARSLAHHAEESRLITQVHGVRARRSQAGLVVNYHCRVSGQLSVEAVHEAVDLLDRAVRADFTDIARIVGHAEPLRD